MTFLYFCGYPIFLRQEGRYCFPDAAYAKILQPLAARNADDQLFLATAAAAGVEPAARVFDWFQTADVLDLQAASLRQKIMPLLIEQMQADEDHSLKEFRCKLLHKADIDICDYSVEGEGGTLFIDDFDAHFHPLLVCYLVRLFHDPEINRANAQIIFSARTTELLSPRLLRRDEIYFVDKDRGIGTSYFYALQEFEPTSQKDIRKAYLLGRYDAVPRVNDGELPF